MRGKRVKLYRKQMQQFSLTFGFREPYQVLVDSQMVVDATRFAMDLPASLSRTLSAPVKLLITQCSIRHLYDLDSSTHPNKQRLIEIAKNMERRRCGHHELETPLSDLKCMQSVIDPKSVKQDTDLVNKFNYVIAAQDEDIRGWCRRVRGTPLVHVKRSVMVMERMSVGSVRVRDGEEKGKLRAGIKKHGLQSITGKRKERGNEGETEAASAADAERSRKRKRGAKEPNPLSVKKAKSKDADADQKPVARVVTDAQPVASEAKGAAENGVAIVETSEKASRRRKRKHKPKGHSDAEAADFGADDEA